MAIDNDRLPKVVPMPTCEDVGRVSGWPCQAFGSRERARLSDADGRVTYVGAAEKHRDARPTV
jgi:hypothetical protein